jgi:hypothetical protein
MQAQNRGGKSCPQSLKDRDMKSAIDHSEKPGRSIARQVQHDPAECHYHYQYEVNAHDEGSLKRGSLEGE